MNILDLPKTEKAAVAFLQERGILQKKRKCKLNHDMKLYIKDSAIWNCRRNTCRLKISMRVGNWFEGSRLSFVTAIRFIYGWAHEQTSMNWCDNVLNIDKGTAVAWNGYMREVAARALENPSAHVSNINVIDASAADQIKSETEETVCPESSTAVNSGQHSAFTESLLAKEIKVETEETVLSQSAAMDKISENSLIIENPPAKKIKVEPEDTTLDEKSSYSIPNEVASPSETSSRKIGGKDKTVEVYESQFSNYKNKGGRVFTPQWIIGGLCQETKECFLVRVLEPNAHTLLDTIENNIKDGSTICTDKWCGYDLNELVSAGLDELKHKYNFVHSSSGVLTHNAQSLWGSAKWRSKKHRGISRNKMDSYLAEFMWRTQLGDKDPFDAILEAISQHWPPEIYSHQWHR